jgi:hypothetical protein
MKRMLWLIPLLSLSCPAPKPYRVTNYFLNPAALSDLRAKRVAVLEFSHEPREIGYRRRFRIDDPGAGIKLADEFNLQLGKLGKFELVERRQIDELFKEQDIDPKRIDPATAVELGRMLGAHGVFLGTVLAYESGRVGASVRLVSVETSRQIWEASDLLMGDDPRVQVLVEAREDRYRLKEDPGFLAQVLCRLLVETLK